MAFRVLESTLFSITIGNMVRSFIKMEVYQTVHSGDFRVSAWCWQLQRLLAALNVVKDHGDAEPFCIDRGKGPW